MKQRIFAAIKAAKLNKANFVVYFENIDWHFKSTLKNADKAAEQVSIVAKIAKIKVAENGRVSDF